MARRTRSANVSVHHTNGIPTPAKTYTDVQSVSVSVPDMEWLRKIDVDFPAKHVTDHVTVLVQFVNPHDDETWSQVRLKVRRDGTVSLDT